MPKKDPTPQDVLDQLRAKNWSLRQLAMANGMHTSALSLALRVNSPKAQKIIADAIGKSIEDIWPSRTSGKKRPGPCPLNGLAA